MRFPGGARTLPLAAVVAAAGAGVPPARAAQDLTLYVEAGTAFPSDPPEFGEFWNAGPGGAVGLGVRLSRTWEFVGAFRYQRFPADEPAQVADLLLSGPGGVSEVLAIEGRDATAVILLGEMRFHFPARGRRWLPFLAFGWGYFELSTSDARVTPAGAELGHPTVVGDTDAALGVTVGAGLEVPIAPGVRVVFDAIHTIGFTERVSTQYLPLSAGFALGP